ncbi:uncharacterized protein LOC134539744 isoform X2 [Bacillus rossius redtenbacheri]|uniref:uncharacterized protein LOC134539744 isoform X2 n=2 Tax=Bacillus rossius redtenbacheri TaxID=93214 RepID=UPI002FDDA355
MWQPCSTSFCRIVIRNPIENCFFNVVVIAAEMSSAATSLSGARYVQVVLESETSSEMSTDESVLSFQGAETGLAKSLSDTSTSSEEEAPPPPRYLAGLGRGVARLFMFSGGTPVPRQPVEFDVASLSEDGGDPLGESGNSSDVSALKVFPGVLAATIAMQDSDYTSFVDGSEESSERPDSELSMTDYWSCVQCKEKNNNPLFRFCERCYRVRKEFFPPRPGGVKTRDGLKRKREEKRNARLKHKGLEASDLSSGGEEAEEVAAKKPRPERGHQAADSGISCSSQEMLSQDLALTLHCASVQDRLKSMMPGRGSVTCGGVDVLDGTGGVTAEGGGVEEGPARAPKRPAEETCGDLRAASFLDEGLPGTSRDGERPESCSSSRELPSPEGPPAALGTCAACRKLAVLRTCIDCHKTASESAQCIICCSQPKNATFVHLRGRIVHTAACYACALRIWKTKKRCPVCNLKIKTIYKNIVV